MDIDQQLQVLIDNCPPDGNLPQMVASVTPALKLMARRLRHLQYYIVQTLDSSWVMLTISHREQPETVKTVIYAFPTLKDVNSGPYALEDPGLLAVPVPVTHILFQLIATPNTDSVVFFETPGNTMAGTEIQRAELESLVHEVFQQATPAGNQGIPSDIA